MIQKIHRDHSRFKQIVQGKVKQEVKKRISKGEMIGKQGEKLISIPLPRIEIPHFRYGAKGNGGVSQGEGEPGTPLGPGLGQPGPGGGSGDEGTDHIMEVDVPLEEMAKILAELLELPDLEQKGKNIIEMETTSKTTPYHGQLKTRVHKKRTLKQFIKRARAMGIPPSQIPAQPIEKRDFWNKEVSQIVRPEYNAVKFNIMDVSGSMEDSQKEIVRIESSWIDTWLEGTYPNLEEVYGTFDAQARVTDKETYYHTRESGSTKISSALKLLLKLLTDGVEFQEKLLRFPPEDWNIYAHIFTDGDNQEEDNEETIELMLKLSELVNLLAYIQVESPYSSSKLIRTVEEKLKGHQHFRCSRVYNRSGIEDSVKDIYGKGKTKVSVPGYDPAGGYTVSP